MLKIRFMKASPLAMAVAVAFLLGGAAQAQTAPAGNLPAGTTKPQNNAVMPAPTAGTGSTGATSSSGTAGSGAATQPGGIAGTTKAKENTANPAPMGGMAKSSEMRDEKAAKKMHKKPMRNKSMSKSSTNDTGVTTVPGTK